MKETGPDAVPPPASSSRDDRIDDRLVPVPDPNLNNIPSVLASVRIDSIVSSTELIKHAEHCGAFSNPQLNQTGLLKAAFWKTSRCLRSSLNACRFVLTCEVALGSCPLSDRVDHATDELLDAPLAGRRAHPPTEILGHDDVRRLLRPE